MTEVATMTREEFEQSAPVPTRHGTLAAALAAFQAELPVIAKANTADVKMNGGGSYSYSYADLADISPVVLKLLGKHGLAWSTQPTMVGENFRLVYSLLWEGGESLDGAYPLPSMNTPVQQMGSAITYARRYALCAVTGVAPGGEDTDAGDLPSGSSREPWEEPQRAPRAQVQPVQPPIAPPVLTQDWFALAKPSKDRGELRAVYAQAEQAGELGLPLPDMGMTVEQFLRSLRENLPEPAPVEPAPEGGWPVTQIPGAE